MLVDDEVLVLLVVLELFVLIDEDELVVFGLVALGETVMILALVCGRGRTCGSRRGFSLS